MRIYVAGKTHDYLRVRALQDEIIGLGHTITFDWTVNVEQVGPDHEHEAAKDEEFLRKCAEDDEYGVKRAQLLVAIGHPKVCGTLVEVGMAIRQGIPVALIGEFPPSVFWRLPVVKQFADEETFLKLGLLPVEGKKGQSLECRGLGTERAATQGTR